MDHNNADNHNQDNNKKKSQKDEAKVSSSSSSSAPSINSDVVTVSLSDIHQKVAEKLVTLCIAQGYTIFGSYVRDHLRGVKFDPTVSDIDIFCDSGLGTYGSFERILRDNGLRCEINSKDGSQNGRVRSSYRWHRRRHLRDSSDDSDSDDDDSSDDSDNSDNEVQVRPFEVFHLNVGLINDQVFLQTPINVRVDFVVGNGDQQPPFKHLDFECNAWLWNRNEIKLSTNTGTNIDTMSHRELKLKEMDILANCQKMTAQYVPLKSLPCRNGMDDDSIRMRKLRFTRIVKLLQKGWTITDGIGLAQVQPDRDDICCLCHDEFSGKCLKMQCCSMKYHHKCFTEYVQSSIPHSKSFTCPQCRVEAPL